MGRSEARGGLILPRYDYRCDLCNHRFELKQSFDSEPVATCPSCEGRARRQFHAVPIVFKGSGWYVNDYGRRNGSTSAPAESKESETSSKAESKSGGEAKSESKSESGAKAESTSA